MEGFQNEANGLRSKLEHLQKVYAMKNENAAAATMLMQRRQQQTPRFQTGKQTEQKPTKRLHPPSTVTELDHTAGAAYRNKKSGSVSQAYRLR